MFRETVRRGGWLAVCLIGLYPFVYSHASTIQGLAWHDTDRNGLRSESEPRIDNATVLLFGIGITTNQYTTVTDSQGQYSFASMPHGQYQVYISVSSDLGITLSKVGMDVETDSDLVLFSYFPPTSGRTATLTYEGTSISNLDGGFITKESSLAVRAQFSGYNSDHPFFVTNGTWVSIVYAISNRGDTALSRIAIIDETAEIEVGSMDCPAILYPGAYTAFTNIFPATSNTTNVVSFSGTAINPVTCEELSITPFSMLTQTVVLVVTEAGAADYDADGFSDWEEVVAGTDAADDLSTWVLAQLEGSPPNVVLPATSSERLYTIYTCNDIAETVQAWSPLAPEQTGNGGALTFVITNLPSGTALRAGVRLP